MRVSSAVVDADGKNPTMRLDQVKRASWRSASPMTGIMETLEFPIHCLDVFGRTQFVVQFFADEGQHHAAENRAQEGPGPEFNAQRGRLGMSGTRAGSTMRMLADFEAAAMPASLILAYSELYRSTSVCTSFLSAV